MKKAIFFLVISFCINDVFAQQSKFITVYSMYQQTMIYNREEHAHKGIIRNTTTYAPSYGVVFSQNINSWLGLDYGLIVSRQEQNYSIYANKEDALPALKNRKRLLYVKIPIFFRAQLYSRPKNNIFFSVGPQLSIMMSEDGVVPVYAGNEYGVASETLSRFDIAEAAGAYKKFTFDVGSSFGWQTKLYKNVFLQFQLRADYGLTDMENKSYSSLVGDQLYKDIYYLYSNKRPASHNIAMGLGIGLTLKIR